MNFCYKFRIFKKKKKIKIKPRGVNVCNVLPSSLYQAFQQVQVTSLFSQSLVDPKAVSFCCSKFKIQQNQCIDRQKRNPSNNE